MRNSNQARRAGLCITLAAILVWPSDGYAEASGIQQCLRDLLRAEVTNEIVCLGLADRSQVQPHLAVAGLCTSNECYIVCIKRVPPDLAPDWRRPLVKDLAIHEMLKRLALDGPNFRQAVSMYKYSDVFLGQMIEEVSGNIDGATLSTSYVDWNEFSGVVLRAPLATIAVRVVKLASERRIQDLYVTALRNEAKVKAEKREYADAANMLLETARFCPRTVTLYKDLYTIYARSGQTQEVVRLSALMTNSCVQDLTFDDCADLARVAQEAKIVSEVDRWQQQGEARIKRGLTLEMLMPAPVKKP